MTPVDCHSPHFDTGCSGLSELHCLSPFCRGSEINKMLIRMAVLRALGRADLLANECKEQEGRGEKGQLFISIQTTTKKTTTVSVRWMKKSFYCQKFAARTAQTQASSGCVWIKTSKSSIWGAISCVLNFWGEPFAGWACVCAIHFVAAADYKQDARLATLSSSLAPSQFHICLSRLCICSYKKITDGIRKEKLSGNWIFGKSSQKHEQF